MSKRIEIILFCHIILFLAACDNQTVSDKKVSIDNASTKPFTQTPQFFLKNDTCTVVRIEKQRVFVVIDSSQANNMNVIKPVLKSIKESYPFDKLKVAFFSDSLYTGYKTDFIKDSSAIIKWANAYIGEYDLLTKEYWSYPLRSESKLKYMIQ